MEYTLKDKLNVTNDFIEELTNKSWQEIEHIQSQIANLADTAEGKKVAKLLNNLLTSYYVFIGCLENFDINDNVIAQPTEEPALELQNEVTTGVITDKESEVDELPVALNNTIENDFIVTEPFEYFVDFDDPIGEPLTDKDLYND